MVIKKVNKKEVKKVIAKKVITKKEVIKKLNSVPVSKKPVPSTKVSTVKPEPKKTILKKVSQAKKKTLVVAPEDKRFWLHNGGVLKDLFDLEKALSEMKVETFKYHTQNGANHFAMWVEIVLGESECARDIEKAKNKKEAVAKVADTLKKYN